MVFLARRASAVEKLDEGLSLKTINNQLTVFRKLMTLVRVRSTDRVADGDPSNAYAFVDYYHEDTTDLRLCKDTPTGRPRNRARKTDRCSRAPPSWTPTPPLLLAHSGLTGTQRTSTRGYVRVTVFTGPSLSTRPVAGKNWIA